MHVVLIIGGYGFLGARIARALAGDGDIRVLVGGRDGERARAVAQSLGRDDADGVAIDVHYADFVRQLEEMGVDTVIHTAGPFQGQDHRVARDAIEAGANYIDLADGRAFVDGIRQLDALARDNGVLAVSGASSVPALSAAVVDRYLPRFSRLEAIRHGISSAARAPGLATMRGVFSYCGKPFTRLEDGQWRVVHGWLDSRRHRFPPPLGPRWLGSCEVPDLDLFPERYPTVRTVTFHAGVASRPGHFAVWAGAWMVRLGLLRDLASLAPAMRGTSNAIEAFGSRNSGMFVEITGTDVDGRPLALTWNLVALDNDGPHVPCGAAIALARKLAREDRQPVNALLPDNARGPDSARLPRGAMPCVGLLSVEEYLDALSGFNVREIPA